MIAMSKVSAVVFNVKSLDRSVSFYKETLGIDFNLIESHDGNIGVANVGEVALVLFENEEPAGRSPIVVFGLEKGIENVVDGLVEHGVEIVLPVSDAPDGGVTADFKDIDGHILSLHQPGDAPRRV